MIKSWKRDKGSVAIEALISTSISIILCVVMLGTLLSIFVDERLEWSLLQTREDMRLYAMPFMGHDRFVQKEINAGILESIINHTFDKQLMRYDLSRLVRVSENTVLKFGPFAHAEYHLSYGYTFPTVFSNRQFILPISAAIVADGIDFNEAIVYISTYGEKFHKGDCFHLRKSKFAIEIGLAKEKGYDPCKNCHHDDPTKE
ncbi:MAG TPA: hypothetical protein DCS67_03500 [Clostridiales bacterium UBA8960]|nr:hypothetical protein [Clostridiales bacterium UBA8960]